MPALPEQSFAASYDLAAKIISAAVIAVCAVIFITTKSVLFGGLALCVITLVYLYSPQSYQITDRSILIRRLVGTVRLSLDSIRELRPGTAEDFRKCARIWGSGGLFGYYGLFKTAELGPCRWFVTDRSKIVLAVANDMTVVLSPSDVPGFLAAVRSVVSVPETTAGQVVRSIEARKTRVPLAAWIGCVVGILAIGVVCVALMYSPGPPELTLTPTSLVIHDRFYPVTVNAADIDVSGIKVVNIRTDQEWTPSARTDGFSNAHYHSGWFRVPSGSVRMYWADGVNLVLLPPRQSGAPVLVQVDNPDQFVERVRQEWTTN